MPSVVIDASTIVGAALNVDSVPAQAIRLARRHQAICLSTAVEAEIREVLNRPKFRPLFDRARQDLILGLLMPDALFVEPTEPVTDCRDAKDNMYLALALAAGAASIVSSDRDLLDLDRGAGFAS